MQPHFNGRERQRKQARDLFGGEPISIVQQNDSLICIRQFAHILIHTVAHLGLLNHCEGRRLHTIHKR